MEILKDTFVIEKIMVHQKDVKNKGGKQDPKEAPNTWKSSTVGLEFSHGDLGGGGEKASKRYKT